MQIQDYIKSSDIANIKRELLEELKQSINDPVHMKKFVKFVSHTHNYSLFNRWLIYAQFPDVTQVMGENAWKTTYNRILKKDIPPINILAPLLKSKDAVAAYKRGEKAPKKAKGAPEEKVLIGYRTVKVYDISQTEGPDVELVTEMGINVDNPEDLLQELVFILSLDNYTIDLQSMGFKEGSKVIDNTIHINKALDLESKIVEILNILSHIHLQHYAKRKDIPDHVKDSETKMVTTIISNVFGSPVNANVDVDSLEDKSITAIFKAADAVAKAVGVSLKKRNS